MLFYSRSFHHKPWAVKEDRKISRFGHIIVKYLHENSKICCRPFSSSLVLLQREWLGLNGTELFSIKLLDKNIMCAINIYLICTVCIINYSRDFSKLASKHLAFPYNLFLNQYRFFNIWSGLRIAFGKIVIKVWFCS